MADRFLVKGDRPMIKPASDALSLERADGLREIAKSFRLKDWPEAREELLKSAELLQALESWRKLHEFASVIARMTTSIEYEDEMPPEEDWISTLNDLIAEARKLTGIEGPEEGTHEI